MGLTKKQIDTLYRKAVGKLDWDWWHLKKEFGEEIARKVLDQKLDKINEMYRLRIQSLGKP